MMKIMEYLRKPKKIFLYLMNKNVFFFIPDKPYLKLKFLLTMGEKLNLEAPDTFNKKLQWLKIYDHREMYTTMVDKAEAKKVVARLIGGEYIIPTIGVYDKFDDINFDKLPTQFVMKCTHDSGGLVICKDKTKMDLRATKKEMNKCLRNNYYYSSREWPYKGVKPRIIIEKYMEDKNSGELIDYKVMCFGGMAKMIFTCTERFGDGLKVTFFDLDWNRLPFERHYPASKRDIPKPENFRKMIDYSEILAKDVPFVRVDWYEINGKLYFGEYTLYPGAGLEEFNPVEWDYKLGDLINLDLIQ